MALGGCLARLRTPTRVQANEGMVLVALMFLFTPLVMAYPMMGFGMSFLDAFFEAVSGVTTTGLSTLATLDGAPSAFLFSRAWMQWYGGLGIVVLSLALVMQPGLLAKGLAVNEVEADDLVGGTKAHTRRVLKVYGALTVIGIVGSLLVGLGLFDAVLYTFAAVSTGGFAPHDGSLATFGWPAQAWITLLCLAGAIPLTLYHRIILAETARGGGRVAIVGGGAGRGGRHAFAGGQHAGAGRIVVGTGSSSGTAAGRFRAEHRGFFLDAVLATGSRLEAGGDFLDDRGRRGRLHRRGIQAAAALDCGQCVSVAHRAHVPAAARRDRTAAGGTSFAGRRDSSRAAAHFPVWGGRRGVLAAVCRDGIRSAGFVV